MRRDSDPTHVGVLKSSNADVELAETGFITLGSHPDCTEKYHGNLIGATVYIVGRTSDDATLYTRGGRAEAMKDSLTTNRSIDQVSVVDLCHDAVVGLLGS
jgi:hypothetical protein